MKIKVYSKKNCGLCEAAKEKLKKMGYEYDEHDYGYHINTPENWREIGSVELLAWAVEQGDPNEQIPTIEINGKFYSYPSAMKKLKQMQKGSL